MMKNKYTYDIFDEQFEDDYLTDIDNLLKDGITRDIHRNINDNYVLDTTSCLSEIDFYPPSDNRVWKSHIEDIDGGDNFADYCKYIFEVYEEEGYYE